MAEHIPQQISSIRDAYAGRLFPSQQFITFSNMDKAFPTRVIKRGGEIKPLVYSDRPLREMVFESNANVCDLYDYVSRNRVSGLLIIKNNHIVFEHYDFGNTEKTRWISMSMAKSISTSLVGAAIEEGYINSIDEPLIKYLPELTGGSYEQVSIKQLLLMVSGVRWNEDQTDANSERRAVLELQIAQQPGLILDYMGKLPRVAKPGECWNYSTGETHVVGALIKAATGQWVADYLSKKIWSPLGMESDATWWLESPEGLEIAGSGINATLRDYGRFGQFILHDGVIGQDRVLPPGWVEAAGGPTTINGKQIPYGYMWWSVPSRSGSFAQRAFSARGIFGQRIYINRQQKLVIVVCSARSKPMGDEVIIDNDFFNAVASQPHALEGNL